MVNFLRHFAFVTQGRYIYKVFLKVLNSGRGLRLQSLIFQYSGKYKINCLFPCPSSMLLNQVEVVWHCIGRKIWRLINLVHVFLNDGIILTPLPQKGVDWKNKSQQSTLWFQHELSSETQNLASLIASTDLCGVICGSKNLEKSAWFLKNNVFWTQCEPYIL